MKIKYEYIRFHKISKPVGRKTNIYHVHNINHGDFLGEVKWFGKWRQYCFFPSSNAVFSGGCLVDVQKFISQLMASRKEE